MTIKVSDSTDIVIARCDLCTDIIYATTRDAPSMAVNYQPYAFICKTYKIYCERCYMVPLLKIKELTGILEEHQKSLEKKYKRGKRTVKARVEKEKKRLDEINNEFY